MDFSITNLSVAFGKNIVVKNVSVEFKKNKIIAIIGPSGCGKTTFLRCLNRLNDLVSNCNVSGSIKYKNVELNDKKCDTIELRKKIGMVFQAPNPFRKTIYKNAIYGLKIQGIRHKNKLDDIVEKSLKKVVLWEEVKDKLNSSAFTLSGGQQQRLCIARALAIQPEVILLDEPTSALDPISSRKIEELLVSLKKEYTIIIVTHSLNQAQRISDYVGMFYDGELIEYGKTSDVFDNPKNNITKMYIENKLD